MNQRQSCCETEGEVTREDVRTYYSHAALSAQESLCCPTQYQEKELDHIPKEVLEISYGCGSPINRAQIKPNEVVVDLGSGGGIDCFIAAKYVGPGGRVIGIDMTEEMLSIARENAEKVTKNLGYRNIEFKQGFLEAIPLEDDSVDLVTSNCVINLSTNKAGVFKEIRRILRPGGRFLIADIISDKPVPHEMRNDRELWGECIAGALTLGEFLDIAQKRKLSGITLKKDYLWKKVNGINFYSYILEGHKFTKPGEASCKTLTAAYGGPFTSVTCGNTTYPLGVPVAIDKNTADLLSSHPYGEHFIIIDPDNESAEPSDSCCG
ncbi:MAG: methyltransferase domain-containing protein [Nitrospinales bacterium]